MCACVCERETVCIKVCTYYGPHVTEKKTGVCILEETVKRPASSIKKYIDLIIDCLS